jgi:hypothetical protein
MKEILVETYRTTKKLTGIDPSKPGNMKQVILDDKAFRTYVTGLAESLQKSDKEKFLMLCENTRVSLLENSMFQINPYEALTLPILRVFYPKLVAKEAVTVSPMDKPECVKAFITANFSPSQSTTKYDAPVIGTDISGGPGIGSPVAASVSVPQSAYDILNAISTGMTSAQAHLERDFEISAVTDGTNTVNVSIVPAVEGHFSSSINYLDGHTDVISGKVDYLNGTLAISSATAKTTTVKYKVTCSLEENRVNPSVELNVDKVRLYAKDRQISAKWTINMEQDMRALFDVSMQAEIVNLLGQQIALDIDREIINALITANTRLNPVTHTGSFTRTPVAGYIWGPKYWHENIIPVMNQLSAQIYNDTNIDAGNTVLANPIDVSILEDINGFAYTGTSTVDGDVGYRTATVAGGKWKILTSAVVAQGTMLMVYKPAEEIKSIYFYCPYVPAVLHPYPLGYIPSLTILSRYATALVRSLGICTLTIGA